MQACGACAAVAVALVFNSHHHFIWINQPATAFLRSIAVSAVLL
jgi:hypothetical protein